MKELTIEQKAQRYDEALECAKSALDCLADEYICNHVTKDDIRGMYAKLFPELKERELTCEDIDNMALEHVKKLNPTLSKLLTKESLRASYYLRGEYDTYRQGLIDMYNKIKK